MKKIYQTIRNFENGNCMQACVASLLELPISSIPNFMENGEEKYLENRDKWCESVGLFIIALELKDDAVDYFKNAYGIALIDSPRSDNGKKHAVIVKGTRVVHDPYSTIETIGYKYDGNVEYLIITDAQKFYRWEEDHVRIFI
jgi:hypothetical protein